MSFLAAEDGAKITGIIERDGALVNENGLDVEAVHAWIAVARRGFRLPERIRSMADGAKVMEAECDILMSRRARLEGVINLANARPDQERR